MGGSKFFSNFLLGFERWSRQKILNMYSKTNHSVGVTQQLTTNLTKKWKITEKFRGNLSFLTVLILIFNNFLVRIFNMPLTQILIQQRSKHNFFPGRFYWGNDSSTRATLLYICGNCAKKHHLHHHKPLTTWHFLWVRHLSCKLSLLTLFRGQIVR